MYWLFVFALLVLLPIVFLLAFVGCAEGSQIDPEQDTDWTQPVTLEPNFNTVEEFTAVGATLLTFSCWLEKKPSDKPHTEIYPTISGQWPPSLILTPSTPDWTGPDKSYYVWASCEIAFGSKPTQILTPVRGQYTSGESKWVFTLAKAAPSQYVLESEK